MNGRHFGRSWRGTELEDNCPCPKAPCGLAVFGQTNPDCDQHPPERCKSIRQSHTPDRCPARPQETTP